VSIRINLAPTAKILRTCNDCAEDKPLHEFHRQPDCVYGREYICKVCRRKRADKWDAAHPGKGAEYAERYRERHPEHAERDNARRRALTEANPGRYSEISKARYRKNKAEYLARNAVRRGIVRQQTPGWADMKAIAAFYAACPPGYHVDHVIPLRGKTVNGLHVLENLQYLPAHENMRKHNRVT
jgi:hypothetical protein